MPLLDHFRPPLSERRPWESLHAAWAGALAAAEEIAADGRFTRFVDLPNVDALFSA